MEAAFEAARGRLATQVQSLIQKHSLDVNQVRWHPLQEQPSPCLEDRALPTGERGRLELAACGRCGRLLLAVIA